MPAHSIDPTTSAAPSMLISRLTMADFAARILERYGAGDPVTSDAALAEVVRAELFALGGTLRRVLASRVAQLLSPLAISVDRVTEVIRKLATLGDLSVGPGGEVACAPLRAVKVAEGSWLLIGTLPSPLLASRFGGALSGLPRRITGLDGETMATRLDGLSARLVTLDRWAGLDRAPAVDAWPAELAARLAAADRYADRAAMVRWEDEEIYTPDPAEPRQYRRWKRRALGEEPALLRARQPGGYHAHAWAKRSGAAGDAVTRVPLSADEARRTTFAVDAGAGAAIALPFLLGDGFAEITLTAALPSAEYRYLIGVGAQAGEGEAQRTYRLDPGMWPAASAQLQLRLGVTMVESRNPG